MSIEVLLIADVKDLGVEGDIVKVADGHARNYLFPQNLGAPVTEATKRKLAKMQGDRANKKKLDLLGASEKATELANLSVTIPVKVAEGEKLYGSIGVADIAAAIEKLGVELDKSTLVIEEPIKELGVYDIKVQLHSEIETTVKVWIVEE
jgi:large subunit ribosomal protein L9